jgi:DNA invertase Pin-like site-specific DNA recombinase
MKVAIYCRLSDEDRNKENFLDDSESIQNQKSLLTKYAIENGWNIYKLYSDDDYSGLDMDRPEWNKMLDDAKAGKFNTILCKGQSRFTRDMELVEKYLHNKFPEWGIRFIGLTDNSDTFNKGNKKQRQIVGLTTEWYCEDVSENIRAVFDAKRQEGKFIGSFAAFGYLKDAVDRNKLIVDEEAAEVVKTIYYLYLEGYGAKRIAAMLNDRGIPNPTKYKQSKGLNYVNSSITDSFGLWNKTTVKRILKNEVYIGNMLQGKRKKVSYKSKKVVSTGQNNWIRADNTHEAIIDKRVFYEVQRRIENRQRSTGDGLAHIFSTKVKCMDCGSTMNKVTAFKAGRRYLSYLRCKTFVTGNNNLCTSHSIRLDLLQSEITIKLREHISSFLDEDSVALRLKEETNNYKKTENINKEIRRTETQLNQTVLAIKNLYLDKVNGSIDIEEFNELNTGFLIDKENLTKKREELERLIKELSEKSGDYDRLFRIIKEYKDLKVLTHTMVNEFIEYIEIGEKDKVTGEQKVVVHWRF